MFSFYPPSAFITVLFVHSFFMQPCLTVHKLYRPTKLHLDVYVAFSNHYLV